MSASEIGHAQNAANFETLIFAVTSCDAAYFPVSEAMKLPALQITLHDARLAIRDVHHDTAELTDAVKRREIAFDGLSNLATRIDNALEIENVHRQIIFDAKTIIHKLQGRRAAAGIEQSNALTGGADEEATPTAAVSQLSFDSRLINFEQLIQLLESQASYAPREADLKTAALRAVLADMKSKNAAAVSAATTLSGSRMVRNEVFYDEETGLVTMANLVKEHIKSIFGADSPQYMQIKDLKFTPPR